MGIASHFEDVNAFGPIIVTISLIQPVYMTLKRPVEKTNGCEDYHDIVKILLEPGSLLVMKDDARYEYRHGIGKSKWVHYFDDGVGSRADTATSNRRDEGSGNLVSSVSASGDATASKRGQVSLRRDDSYRRVSLTIRHLLRTRRKVEGVADEQDTIKDPSAY